jgi:ribosomal RNA assembly protein
MKTVIVENPKKISKAVPLIEKKVKVRISQNKNSVLIDGNEINEFYTERILQAIDFGFEPEDTMLLIKDDYVLEYVNIKEHTHRKNLGEIRARIIGTDGKAKAAIENLTASIIVIHENRVGIIADTNHIQQTIQSIVSLVQGAKHGNVFSYLEKQNANLRGLKHEDLGLRDPKKDRLDSDEEYVEEDDEE